MCPTPLDWAEGSHELLKLTLMLGEWCIIRLMDILQRRVSTALGGNRVRIIRHRHVGSVHDCVPFPRYLMSVFLAGIVVHPGKSSLITDDHLSGSTCGRGHDSLRKQPRRHDICGRGIVDLAKGVWASR